MSAAELQPQRFLDYEKSLACIHCGLCLSACPTYLETGNENNSPRGRIYLMRAVQDGRLPLGSTFVRHIDLCLGCRACEAACPSGVKYGELLETTREHIEKHFERGLGQSFLRRAIEGVIPFAGRMSLALQPAHWARKLGGERWLPKFARETLALVPEEARAETLPELSPATGEPKRGRVGFVSGCVMSVMFGPTNAASVFLLNRAGYDVVTPPAQVCCGALYAHGGSLEKARECARRNIVAFEQAGLDAIVTNAAGCGSTLKEYGHLLHDDPAWAERGRNFSATVKDLTEFLVATGFQLETRNSIPGTRVTFHDACHLAHAQRLTQPPRELVRAVAGKSFVEMPECDLCCGSAGSYNLTQPEMAARLQQRKVQNILKTGAAIVVTTNPGCILQVRAGLRQAGAGHVQVLHIADFLKQAIETAEK